MWPCKAIVIRLVVLAIFLQTVLQLLFEDIDVLTLRIPVHVKRLYFSAKEVVWTTGAEFSQPRSVTGIDEPQDVLIVLNCAYKPVLLADLAPKPRQDHSESLA